MKMYGKPGLYESPHCAIVLIYNEGALCGSPINEDLILDDSWQDCFDENLAL